MSINWFIQIDGNLLARSDLTPSAKIIFGLIAFRVGKNGVAWPGYRRIAGETGLTVNTVRRAADLFAF